MFLSSLQNSKNPQANKIDQNLSLEDEQQQRCQGGAGLGTWFTPVLLSRYHEETRQAPSSGPWPWRCCWGWKEGWERAGTELLYSEQAELHQGLPHMGLQPHSCDLQGMWAWEHSSLASDSWTFLTLGFSAECSIPLNLQNIHCLQAEACRCWNCQRSINWDFILGAACSFLEESGRCDPGQRGKYELQVAAEPQPSCWNTQHRLLKLLSSHWIPLQLAFNIQSFPSRLQWYLNLTWSSK